MKDQDLWPEFTIPDVSGIPVRLMVEMALELTRLTGGYVHGILKLSQAPTMEFWIGFYLMSPSLGDYTYLLFSLTHSFEFYPASLMCGLESHDVKTPQQLRDILKVIAHSPETARIIAAITAQSAAVEEATDCFPDATVGE